jgi:hypothetical protein
MIANNDPGDTDDDPMTSVLSLCSSIQDASVRPDRCFMRGRIYGILETLFREEL